MGQQASRGRASVLDPLILSMRVHPSDAASFCVGAHLPSEGHIRPRLLADALPRFVLPDGATLHHETLEGEGRPVLLLHGVLGELSDWDAVATRLHAHGRRVVRLDARGHGASTPWHEGMSWRSEDDARDVEAFLREYAPEGVHVVGHSRGGMTAGWLAVAAPELVTTLTVVASPPQPSEVFRTRFRREIPRARDARTRAAFEHLAALPEDDSPAHALRRYEGRALVVEAEDDPLYSPTHTLFWRMFLPYADFERVPGAHAFFQEDEAAAHWLADRLHRFFGSADATK